MSIFLFVLLSLFSKPVLAYLDPGSGSFILQFIMGILAAIGSFFVFYFNKAKEMISKFFSFFKKKK